MTIFMASFTSSQEGASQHGDAFSPALGAQALATGGLDRDLLDLTAQGSGQGLTHGLGHGCDAGLLGDDGQVDDAQDIPPGSDQIPGLLQLLEAVRPEILRIGVREVATDVPQRSRPQQGISHRMTNRITIGMPHRPGSPVRELDPAQHAAAPVRKRMETRALADAGHGGSRVNQSKRSASLNATPQRSLSDRIVSTPGNNGHSMPMSGSS
jgi:hypothetical protein